MAEAFASNFILRQEIALLYEIALNELVYPDPE